LSVTVIATALLASVATLFLADRGTSNE